jgi:formamidopyrimidine-DNA glycosylase
MPELPEVETVRRGLRPAIVGRTIRDVEVLHPRSVRRHEAGAADFAAALAGRTVLDVRRRGKYLWLVLPDDRCVVGHLGMSGQLLLATPGDADGPHLRARLAFTDGGTELRFVDQRTFGGLAITPLIDDGAGDTIPSPVAHIARDLFDPAIDEAALVTRFRARSSAVKRVLLDQTVVSGVGNIYADEALWRARIHPERIASRLTRADVVALLGHARDVMREALGAGGTSFDALYVNVNGASGWFDRRLAVYGREGESCPRCGSPIRRISFMNRSSHLCPRCQRPGRSPAG